MRAALKKVISLDFGGKAGVQPATSGIDTLVDDGKQRTALLATSDKVSQHWAPRWLEHAGLEVRVVVTPDSALEEAASGRPDLMIVDAAFQDADSCLLINALREARGEESPLLALCTSAADVALAAEAAVSDIARRPFDWQIITQRAVQNIRAHEAQQALRAAQSQLDRLQTTATEAARERALAAGIDALTELPNAQRFRSLSHKAIAGRNSEKRRMALIVIGLDRYRMVNEAVGHDNGNALLSQFADRLRSCVGDRTVIGGPDSGTITAIAARVGGSRFAVQVANGDDQQILRIADAIGEQLEQPFQVDGQSIYLTASVGAAMYPQHTDSADELLHFAETAMMEAQDSGSAFYIYEPRGRNSVRSDLKLDNMLRDAIRNDELSLYYQPITDTESGKVVAAEALLRWTHATEGEISPARFVPLAERTGLMREIGNYVIESACARLRSWIDDGMEPIRIAINMSLCQLLRGDVVSVTRQVLEKYDIHPSLLEIELSERGVLNRRPEVVAEIRRLKELGVRISIDDFGTGQAAIAYLKDLPIDVIKIDRSYVSGSSRSKRDEAIASGIVALAQRLDATVIAEGVETTEQLAMLREWGSHECQGFLFSRAVPASEFRSRFA